ncbi:polymeric immunoglobulin receptor-like [Eucyclogobius newberryi]|uniref:polymeric immunoglobulin receptor-like n=1 Tax=Eucyclogobius newberryi TaxID=166745 RepID=UPI003B5C647C
MTVCVTFALIWAGLTGIHSLKTVDHVVMEVGGTVHIPCQYEEKYLNNVKYLCLGQSWSSCKSIFDNTNSAKYSIDDDKRQRIVTFTIKSLKSKDSDHYWCAIERTGADDGQLFQLSVKKKNKSTLTVDSQFVTGYFDGQITINCKHEGSGLIKWCSIGGPCISSSGKINGAQVSTDPSVDGVFAVTMSGLTAQNIGWYWCGFGDLQMPVFLEVTERPTTTTIATTTVSTATAPVFPMNRPEITSVSNYMNAAAIALGLLIIIVIVSLVAWFTLKRKVKKTELDSSASSEGSDSPVYGNVTPWPTSHQNACAPKEMEVLYSSVTFMNNKASKKGADKEEDVLYSTLAQH